MDDAIGRIAELLAQAGVDYALIGGHAVNVWLEPRFTADVDVTVQASPPAMARLKAVLAAAGYAVAQEHGGAPPSGPDFVRFVSVDGRVTLEVQCAKTEFQREIVRRAAAARDRVRVATPEDLVVMKLIARRAKDRIDLEGLTKLPALDWDYIERWARAWGVAEHLHHLREPPASDSE